MSSAGSGRYQSRLFNFVYKQSRRFTRSCDRVFRNIQVTTNWVAAVGLYPLVLLFQSTRSTAQQIHQAVQQSLPQLPAPETEPLCVDTPIQQVLLSIEALSAQLVISPSGDTRELGELGKLGELGRKATHHSPLTTRPSPLATRPSIQGIATQLSSQTLVLVTAQNEILDILTSTQQEKLQTQIITAIADEGRYQTELGKLGKLGRHRENSEFRIPSVLAFLDRTVAVVESNHVVPGKEVAIALFSKANQSSGLVGRIQTQIGRFLSKGTSAINPNGGSSTDTTRIQALIRAAIGYFFGTHPSKRVEQTTPTDLSRISPIPQTVQQLHPFLSSKNSQTQSKQLKERYQAAKLSAAKLSSAHLPPSSQPVNSGIEDPWLCESDLFGESVTSEKLSRHQLKHSTSKTKMSGSRNSVSSQDSTRYYLSNLVNSFRKFLPQPKPTSEIVKGQKINKGQLVGGTVSIKQSSSVLKSPRQDISNKFAQTCNSNTQIEPAPDWIETNATVMGYVKHPLEQLLAWLDGAMLWLEEVLLKFWQWLTRD